MDDETGYLIVTPDGPWTWWLSSNVKGYPAVHIVNVTTNEDGRTLCGKEAFGWQVHLGGAVSAELVVKQGRALCKTCHKCFDRLQARIALQ